MPRNRKNGKPEGESPPEQAPPSPEQPEQPEVPVAPPVAPKPIPTPQWYALPYLRGWRATQHPEWTQADLARAAGMSEYGVRRLELMYSRAKIQSALALARALGVTLDELVSVDPTKAGPKAPPAP